MLGPNETYIISDRKYFTQYFNSMYPLVLATINIFTAIEEKLSFQTPIKNLLLISSIWTDSAHSDKITNIVQPEAVRKVNIKYKLMSWYMLTCYLTDDAVRELY